MRLQNIRNIWNIDINRYVHCYVENLHNKSTQFPTILKSFYVLLNSRRLSAVSLLLLFHSSNGMVFTLVEYFTWRVFIICHFHFVSSSSHTIMIVGALLSLYPESMPQLNNFLFNFVNERHFSLVNMYIHLKLPLELQINYDDVDDDDDNDDWKKGEFFKMVTMMLRIFNDLFNVLLRFPKQKKMK